MRFTGAVIAAILLATAAVPVENAAAQTRAATVTRAQRVLIRSGPGVNFEAFGSLAAGERVEVESLAAGWALVKTAAGERGYMSGFYLAYLDGTQVVGGAGAPTPGAPAPGAPAAADDVARPGAELAAQVAGLEREVGALRGQLDRPSAGEDIVAFRAEVRRLADTTDALRSRLDAPGAGPIPVSLAGGEHWSTPTVVVLTTLALLVGWLIGGGLARREERSKRNRIRF